VTYDVDVLHSSRQVDVAEGEKLAKAIGCAFVETSAKNDINVGEYKSLLLLDGKRKNLTVSRLPY
jgi:hypothetical protein